jgi:putative two-component system response regulator
MPTAEAGASRILVVEDQPMNAKLLQTLLAAQGYQVMCAADGLEALVHIAQQPPDLIFLDLNLPLLSGYEVCRRIKQDPATRLIPVVIVTGEDPFEARLKVWDLGADEFISKPIHNMELIARCKSLLRVKRLNDELETAQSVLFALARTVEAKSPYTHGHAGRVADYAAQLAEQLGLAAGERELLRRGAVLHDIGKLSIPDEILNKPGPLTAEEYTIVKRHAEKGAAIVDPLRSLRDTVPMVRWHHERMDGQGYPDGLSGHDIPLPVRLLSVVDVYDSLSSPRPYRGAIPKDMCVGMLHENAAGGGLDPELVEHFVAVLHAPERTPPAPVSETHFGSKTVILPHPTTVVSRS